MYTKALEGRVRAREITVAEAVHETPIESLDAVLPMLKRHGKPKEVCTAFFERISKAPLGEFVHLRSLFDKHCAGFLPDDTQV